VILKKTNNREGCFLIKAIIFDFDGVICESANIKTEAFGELFSQWPDVSNKALEYHLVNTGVTRFQKFRYLYEELLRLEYTDEIGEKLSDDFSAICFERVKQAPFVKGAQEFLEEYFEQYKLFVASASPLGELKETIRMKNLEKYFGDIYGHPSLKKDVVKGIMQSRGYKKSEVVFVGDGESDLKAAKCNDVFFVLRKTSENDYLFERSKYKIDDLSALSDLILKLPN